MRTFDDFTVPGFWRDPHAAFRNSFASEDRLQANPGGGYSVLGFDLLSKLGRHPALDGTPMPTPAAGGPSATYALFRHALFTQVAPRHHLLRTAALAGLSMSAVATFGSGMEHLVAQRIESLKASRFDLVTGFVGPIAAEAWCRFMGYDAEDAPALVADVARITAHGTFEPDPATAGDAEQAAASVLARTAAMLRNDRDTPATRIARALPAGDPDLAIGVVASLVLDALDTGVAGLAGLLAVLIGQPEFHHELGDVAARNAAIEEALRLATPAVLTVRQAREDVVVDGHTIENGARVLMWWAAGNVDPEAFGAPAEFRPGRKKRAMPFGVGAHTCLGHVWIKPLAHALVAQAFAGKHRLRCLAPDFSWVSGGARRPHGLVVAFA